MKSTDLPIDINAIGRTEGYDDAITYRRNIDLFSPSARQISDRMTAQSQQQRDTATESLFTMPLVRQEAEPQAVVRERAETMALFAQPVNFGGLNSMAEQSTLSGWLAVPVLLLCAAGGFVWALRSGKKKREHAHVH